MQENTLDKEPETVFSISTLWAIAKALLFLGVFAALFIGSGAVPLTLPKLAVGIVGASIISIAMVGVTYLFVRSDKLTMSNVGMDFGEGSLKRFFLGLAAGMGLFSCIFLIFFWLTPLILVSPEEFHVLDAVVLSFFTFLMLSVMEEIAFRGYLMRKLGSAVGIRAAIYASSILFAFYHGLSIDNLAGPGIWGLLYGVLAYRSKGLAVPIGFHAGLNYVQALLSQKERYANGIWSIDVVEKITPFTPDQISIFLKVMLLIFGAILIEVYISKNKKVEAVG